MDVTKIKNRIKLSQNENPLGPSTKAYRAVIENGNDIFRYPEPHSNSLTKKIAEKRNVSEDNVFVSAGIVESLDILIRNFIGESENIIIPKLSFVAYKLLGEVLGVEVRFADMTDYRIDIDAILKHYNQRTKLIIIASPNNPTGTIVTESELLHLLDNVSKDTLVVLDEAYAEYASPDIFLDSRNVQKKYPNLIILRTFSKIYGLAGLRVGYAIADAKIINQLHYYQAPFTVNYMASIAAMAALDDDEFVQKSYRMNNMERRFLMNEFTQLGYKVVPSESNFLFVTFDTKTERDEVSDLLAEKGVLVRETDAFGDENALRITVGERENNEQVIEYLSKELTK